MDGAVVQDQHTRTHHHTEWAMQNRDSHRPWIHLPRRPVELVAFPSTVTLTGISGVAVLIHRTIGRPVFIYPSRVSATE